MSQALYMAGDNTYFGGRHVVHLWDSLLGVEILPGQTAGRVNDTVSP